MSTSSTIPDAKVDLDASIGDLFSSVLSGINADNDRRLAAVTSNELIIAAERAIADRDPEAFRFALEYPLAGVVDALLRRAFPKSAEARFLFTEHAFIRLHFRNLFQKHEGFVCCNDKAGTVLRKLLRFYLDDTPIAFDWTEKYTYAFPTKIFTQHDEIIDFFNSLRFLSRGRSDQFVEQILKIEAKNAAPDTAALIEK